jgi:hypothetical protein
VRTPVHPRLKIFGSSVQQLRTVSRSQPTQVSFISACAEPRAPLRGLYCFDYRFLLSSFREPSRTMDEATVAHEVKLLQAKVKE